MANSVEVKVGVQYDPAGNLSEFGADEVNRLIAEGWRVVGVQGSMMARKMRDNDNGTCRMAMVGFGVTVRLETPNLATVPRSA